MSEREERIIGFWEREFAGPKLRVATALHTVLGVLIAEMDEQDKRIALLEAKIRRAG